MTKSQKAEYATQLTAAKMEHQYQQMAQQVEQQKTQSVQEAQVTKEVQQMAQSSILLSQQYEEKFGTLTAKMGQMEVLLVNQTQKSSRLESELFVV